MRALLHNTKTGEYFDVHDEDEYAGMMDNPVFEDCTGILEHERAWRVRAGAAGATRNPVADYLARAVKHYDKTGTLPAGSTSEQLMVAFAIERWDLVNDLGQQYLDPLNAWYYRLNQPQRAAVLAHRAELAQYISTHKL